MLPELNEYPELTMVEITMKLFNRTFLSDVQIVVDDKIIHAHSLILTIRSEVFQHKLESTPGRKKVIPIDDIAYSSVHEFVRFIYTDKCDMNPDNIGDIFKLAKRYKVLHLEHEIYRLFYPARWQLTLVEQCLMKANEQQLEELIEWGFLRNFFGHERFLSLHPLVLEKIVDNKFVSISEFEKFEAIGRWLKRNLKRVKPKVPDNVQLMANLSVNDA